MRFLIFAVIGAVIYFSIRSILSDWRKRFSELDGEHRARDKREAKRPDVVELKRDNDGVFRPKDKDKGE